MPSELEKLYDAAGQSSELEALYDKAEPKPVSRTEALYDKAEPKPVSRTEALVTGAGTALEDLGRGAAQLVTSGAEKLGIVDPGTSQRLTDRLSRERQFQQKVFEPVKEARPGLFKAGQVAGNILPFAAIPSAGAGLLAKTAGSAATGAGIGALQFAPKEGDRAKNVAAGAILGAAATGLAAGASKAVKGILGQNLKALDTSTVSKAEAKQALKSLKTAKKEDIKLTPGEATGDINILQKELNVIASKKGRKALDEFQADRAKKLITKVRSAVNKISSDADKAKIEELYSKAYTTTIDKTDDLLDDPIILKLYNKVSKDPLTGAGKFKTNELGRFDLVKREMDRLMENKEVISQPLANAKKKLVDALDDAVPVYKEARDLAQRKIIQQDLLSKMDTIKTTMKDKPTLLQIHNKLFGSEEAKQEILKSIKQVGGDVNQVKDVMKLIEITAKSPVLRAINKDPESLTRLAITEGPGGLGFKLLMDLRQRSSKKHLLELMTNKDYSDSIKSILRTKSKKEQLASFSELLGRISASESTKEE